MPIDWNKIKGRLGSETTTVKNQALPSKKGIDWTKITNRLSVTPSNTPAPLSIATPTTPTIKRNTLPAHLGGGSYNSVVGKDNELALTKRGSVSDKDKETEIHHIFGVALGGLSEEPNYIKLNPGDHLKVTKLQDEVLSQYKSGKISLPQARLATIAELQKISDEAKGISQKNINLGGKFGKFADKFTASLKSAISSYGSAKASDYLPTKLPVLEARVGQGLTPEQTQRAEAVVSNINLKTGQPYESLTQDIKIPFKDKGITIPKREGLAGVVSDVAKYTVESPEKVFKSLNPTRLLETNPEQIRQGALAEKQVNKYNVPSFQEDLQTSIDNGVHPLAAFILTGGSAVLDIAAMGNLTKSTLSSIAKAKIKPAPVTSLKWKDLSDITRGVEVAPEKMAAFHEASKSGTNWVDILKKEGQINIQTGEARTLGEVLSDIKSKSSPFSIFKKAEKPVIVKKTAIIPDEGGVKVLAEVVPEKGKATIVLNEGIEPALIKQINEVAEAQIKSGDIKPITEDVILEHEIKKGLDKPLEPQGEALPAKTTKVSTKAEEPLREEANILRGTKGMTADDIMKTYSNIQLKKDIPATTIDGVKKIIPKDEKLTPYELKGNKILLQDGETYIVTKNQFQNIKGQSIIAEGKPFAPELGQTEETAKSKEYQGRKLTSQENSEMNELSRRLTVDGLEGADKARWNELAKIRNNKVEWKDETKYGQYQLPGGENYKEVLIKAPSEYFSKLDKRRLEIENKGLNATHEEKGEWAKIQNKLSRIDSFKSSHWDEPNVISHLRLNERTYNGKKVTFMEELQSDWAREGRSKGFAPSAEEQKIAKVKWEKDIAEREAKEDAYALKHYGKPYEDLSVSAQNNIASTFGNLSYKEPKFDAGIPNNPLLKNWQELSVKRALKEAVDNGSEYFAWINGEQTAARYNLSKEIDNIKWEKTTDNGKEFKDITLTDKDGKLISIEINSKNEIVLSSKTEWEGKKLSEVIGKGVSEKIIADVNGNLAGEGLNIGGEWASNLYDRQVKSIVEDLTGAKVETITLSGKLTNGATGEKEIMELPGKQQGIKLTPEVIAKIKGEAPKIETSGKMFAEKPVKEAPKKALPKQTKTNTVHKVFRGTNQSQEKISEAGGGDMDFGPGYYFADSKETAKSYGDTVSQYTITLKNPLKVKDRYEMNSVWDKFVETNPADNVDLRDWLKSQGYDGVLVENGGMGSEDIGGFKIVFDKSQIKEVKKALPRKKKVSSEYGPDEFRQLVKNIPSEKLAQLDYEGLQKILKSRGVNGDKLDNIIYSQELGSDDSLEVFKTRLLQDRKVLPKQRVETKEAEFDKGMLEYYRQKDGLPEGFVSPAEMVKSLKNITIDSPLVKEAKRSLYPLKSQKPEIQKVFREWNSVLIMGKERARKEAAKLPLLGKEKGLKTIIDYQAGRDTELTKDLQKVFNDLYQEARTRGLDTGYSRDYLPQVYANSNKEIEAAAIKYLEDQDVSRQLAESYVAGDAKLPEELSRRLKFTPSFDRSRVFPDYETAIKYELTPRYNEPSQLAGYYRDEMEKTFANKALINDLAKNGDLKTATFAPENWVPITTRFSPSEYYASPKLGEMINSMFRDENNLGFGATLVKGTAGVSKLMQEVRLSAGFPMSSLNYFTTSQTIKELTQGVGALVTGDFRGALSSVKVIPAYIRSNFDSFSIKYFAKYQNYIDEMAEGTPNETGIDLSNRVGKYNTVSLKTLIKSKSFGKFLGEGWNRAFGEKTFNSFMPMGILRTYKDTKNALLARGVEEMEARTTALMAAKAYHGLVETIGRSKTVQDTLGSIFFAPRFREGIINTLMNVLRGATTQIKNPAFRKSRQLLLGMGITYILYDQLNRKLNGHGMHDNPAGKEDSLMIKLKDGAVAYIPFMPSYLSIPRNFYSAGMAFSKGDIAAGMQKLSGNLSMGLKLASEVLSNRDYFGREIYSPEDTRLEKAKKLTAYSGLAVNHPYIEMAIKYNLGKIPFYQAMSQALELPFKFGSLEKIAQSKYYDQIEKNNIAKAQEKAKFKKEKYDKIMLLDGIEYSEAVKDLTDEEYAIFKAIRTAEKTKETMTKKPEIFKKYEEYVKLMEEEKEDEANAIWQNMTDADYKIFKSIYKSFN